MGISIGVMRALLKHGTACIITASAHSRTLPVNVVCRGRSVVSRCRSFLMPDATSSQRRTPLLLSPSVLLCPSQSLRPACLPFTLCLRTAEAICTSCVSLRRPTVDLDGSSAEKEDKYECRHHFVLVC